jgi:hypothetical protein
LIQDKVIELRKTYDGINIDNPICGIGNQYNLNRTCILNFTSDRDMEPPILIHYELTNFHQNHRSYYTSRDPSQLLGHVGDQSRVARQDCDPLNKLGDIHLNPCGLIANTLFNDYFTLLSGNDVNGQPLVMMEEGIAWGSDIKYMYAQPVGFDSEECPNGCTDDCCAPEKWSCTKPYQDKKTGTCYRYTYPEDDKTQYLHETYPDIISPLEGVTNEHFIVWMRIAAQPTFRKLYGWIDQPIAAGEVLSFQVNANYVVTRFAGSKSLLVGTTSIFGGRNPYLSRVFYIVGGFCLVAGAFFALKHAVRPRKLADPSYLHYKEH